MKKNKTKNPYRVSGVDIEKGDHLVDWLIKTGKRSSKSAHSLGSVVSGIGGFAALFRPNLKKMKDPLLISSTDGVGTKVLLGMEHKLIEGLGIDLVAMCVNDLYTLGGRPLFFLDYYATGSINAKQFQQVLTGIRKGLAQCESSLLGGETAEMPGLYEKGHFDIAGFIVGVVDGRLCLGPQKVMRNSKLYALKSTGFHSNGFSLIRHWLKNNTKKPSLSLIRKLLEPTKIYYEIPKLIDKLGPDVIQAAANITGGGISGNLPRVIPNHLRCRIEKALIPTPRWMADFINEHGSSFDDVENTFNLGAGMILVVNNKKYKAFEKALESFKLDVCPIGDVIGGSGSKQVCYV